MLAIIMTRTETFTNYWYMRTLSSALLLLELRRAWVAYLRKDRPLLENDTICEAVKISISQYIKALRSMVLFLVSHESKPELILGQYTPKRWLYSRISRLLLKTSTRIFQVLFFCFLLSSLGCLDKIQKLTACSLSPKKCGNAFANVYWNDRCAGGKEDMSIGDYHRQSSLRKARNWWQIYLNHPVRKYQARFFPRILLMTCHMMTETSARDRSFFDVGGGASWDKSSRLLVSSWRSANR